MTLAAPRHIFKCTPAAGRVVLGLETVDGMARVWVEDTGSGIAIADQQRIFQEFQQVKGTASEFAGTGLGLALCRFFMDVHGGTIGVRSEVGVGSIFAFTLPLAPDEPHVGANGFTSQVSKATRA